MNIRTAVRWVGAAALAALVGAAAHAQQIRGISFTVTGVDGKPVVGAKVTLTDLSNERNVYTGVTDERGEYLRSGIQYSTKGYKFAVEVSGGTVVRFVHNGDPDLKSDDTGERKILLSTLNQLKVDLRKAVGVKGIVKSETGSPVGGARIKATDLDDETKSFDAAANGRGEYEFTGMPYAIKGYSFTISRDGAPPVVQRYAIPHVGMVQLDLDLSATSPQGTSVPAKASAAQDSKELYGLGDYEGALSKAEEAQKSEEDPTNRKAVLLIKGQCLDKLGRPAEAMAVFEEYLQTDPKNPEVVGVLARLAEAAGDAKKAEEYKKQYVAMGGKVTADNYNKGVEALNEGRAKDAVLFFQKAIADDPMDADAHRELAKAYAQTGNYRGVVDNLKAYLKLKPDAEDRGQWETAIPQFEEMAKPKN